MLACLLVAPCAQPRELAGLLGVSEAAAQLLADREPLVLTHPLSRLRESLSALAAALKVRACHMGGMVHATWHMLVYVLAFACLQMLHLKRMWYVCWRWALVSTGII